MIVYVLKLMVKFTEPENLWGWKRSVKTICPNHPYSEHGQLEQVTQDYFQSDFERLQAWWLHSFSWQPPPVFSHLHSKKFLLSILPVFQIVSLALFQDITEANLPPSSLSPSSLNQIFIHTDKIPPEPSLIKYKQPLLSQAFHVCCSPYIIAALGWTATSMSYTWEPGPGHSNPSVTTPVLSRAEGSPHWPAGSALPYTAQEVVGFLFHEGTLLAYSQPAVQQDTQVFFCKATSQLISTQPSLVPGVIPLQVQDFALPIVEPHEVPISPFPQPVKVPVHGSTTLWCISHSFQFRIMCRAPPRNKETWCGL